MKNDNKLKFEQWRASLVSVCGEFNAIPDTDKSKKDFHGSISFSSPLNLITKGVCVSTNCAQVVRTPVEIKQDGKDHFYLLRQVSGCAKVEHAHSAIILSPGEMVLLDSSKPCGIHPLGLIEQISITVPRRLVTEKARSPLRLNEKISSQDGLPKMVKELSLELYGLQCSRDCKPLVTAFLELLVVVFCHPNSNEMAMAPERVMLQRAKRAIDENLKSNSLSPSVVANEVGVSCRTLHRLFSECGTTFGKYVLDKRLKQCARELEAKGHSKISLISSAWGFNYVSYFSRAFKDKYGVTPRDYSKCYKG